jgi:hypothetical protein
LSSLTVVVAIVVPPDGHRRRQAPVAQLPAR